MRFTNLLRATASCAVLAAFAAGQAQKAALDRAIKSPPPVPPPRIPYVAVEPRLLYNPALKSRLFRARNMLAGSLEGERPVGDGVR